MTKVPLSFVTVYEPDPKVWDADFKRRRQS